jgi:hypothetical protein
MGVPSKEPPLTVEALLRILKKPECMTVAGYMGSCERVIRFDVLVDELDKLTRRTPT